MPKVPKNCHTDLAKSFGTIAIIQALLIGENLQWIAYFLVQVEGIFSSVERTRQFTQGLEQEPPRSLRGDIDLEAKNWPPEGSGLEFKNVCVRYSPNLPRALDSLRFHISSCEKIGIVGRTGSGKSTIMGALFRLFPLEEGQVLLGGIDVSTLGLTLLRRRITIVPQDPILFSGELRRNLDPLNVHPDTSLWDVLQRCGLKDFVCNLEGGLLAEVAEGGSNFSVGERQILCLARALLRKACILCFDEATANVDPTSDARMQKVLSTELQDCISMTIAHRLRTVMSCNRILVLDAGKLAQFDAPEALLTMPGIFQALAAQAGIHATPEAGDARYVLHSASTIECRQGQRSAQLPHGCNVDLRCAASLVELVVSPFLATKEEKKKPCSQFGEWPTEGIGADKTEA